VSGRCPPRSLTRSARRTWADLRSDADGVGTGERVRTAAPRTDARDERLVSKRHPYDRRRPRRVDRAANLRAEAAPPEARAGRPALRGGQRCAIMYKCVAVRTTSEPSETTADASVSPSSSLVASLRNVFPAAMTVVTPSS